MLCIRVFGRCGTGEDRFLEIVPMWLKKIVQWRSQSAKKVTHIKGRLLDQAVILQLRPFSKWELLLKERIRSLGVSSFLLEQFLLENHFYHIR